MRPSDRLIEWLFLIFLLEGIAVFTLVLAASLFRLLLR